MINKFQNIADLVCLKVHVDLKNNDFKVIIFCEFNTIFQKKKTPVVVAVVVVDVFL
jgi:hypothetical protein